MEINIRDMLFFKPLADRFQRNRRDRKCIKNNEYKLKINLFFPNTFIFFSSHYDPPCNGGPISKGIREQHVP